MDHHTKCGGFEFTKSTLQRDEATGDRFYRYRCLKCGAEIHEALQEEPQMNLPLKEAA